MYVAWAAYAMGAGLKSRPDEGCNLDIMGWLALLVSAGSITPG